MPTKDFERVTTPQEDIEEILEEDRRKATPTNNDITYYLQWLQQNEKDRIKKVKKGLIFG